MRMRKGQTRQSDFHLNIVPIVDCLTILITFMLASGVYLSIGLLQVGVAAPGESVNPTQLSDSTSIDVHMKFDRSLVIKTNPKKSESVSIPPEARNWNLNKLQQTLQSVEQQLNKVGQVTLVAHKEISYEHIIEAMNVIKKVFPKNQVQLGGF